MASLNPIHWKTITPGMKTLLAHLGHQTDLPKIYLAGGTALALRLGHRRSVDLDFFSESDPLDRNSRQRIEKTFSTFDYTVLENTSGNLLMRVQGIHVGFFSYGYILIAPLEEVLGVPVASTADIGLMKLDAIISRGSRKDFYDLYTIVQEIPLAKLFRLGEKKYPHVRNFEVMAIEAMVMFENADRDLQPELFNPLPWEEVKDFFIEQAKQHGQSWIEGKEHGKK